MSESTNRQLDEQTQGLSDEQTNYPKTTTAISNAVAAAQQVVSVSQQLALENRLRFLDLSPDLFGIANQEGYFTYVNPTWEKLLGFTLTELTERPYLHFVHPDDIVATSVAAQKLSEGIAAVGFENRYRTTAGTYRWISWNVTTVPAENKFYAVGRDVTKRKQADTERAALLQREQAAREAAEEANRVKDEFLAVVSHELRSPLHPILSWSQLLQRGTLSAEKTKLALQSIERNAKIQAQLIGDLLDISRILRGKIRLDAAPVEMSSVVSAAMETVRFEARAKEIDLQIVESAADCTVRGDAGRLQQVVWKDGLPSETMR